MLRSFCFLTMLFGLISSLGAQQPIRITNDDLPDAGDTFRMSVAANPQLINTGKQGPDQTWNYASLTWASQFVDTFQPLSALPSIYGLLQFQKNVDYGKQEGALLENLPGTDQLPIDEVLGFYSKGNQAYEQTAFGLGVIGQDVPVPFQDDDRIYKLPMTDQQQDSAKAFVQFPPSNLPFPDTFNFYFEESRKRINNVDAWGTLTTPYGTFKTLRVRTVVKREDSISFQGLNQAVSPPDQVLYRWLTKDGGKPVLQVRAQKVAGREVISNVVYQDSARNRGGSTPTGVGESPEVKVEVFPNPASGQLRVRVSDHRFFTYSLTNMAGQRVRMGTIPAAHGHTHKVSVSRLPAGVYVLKFKGQHTSVQLRKRIVVR